MTLPIDTIGAVYLAASGFESQLQQELGPDAKPLGGGLWGTQEGPRPLAWAQNIWLKPEILPIASIGQAVKELRARGRNWAGSAFQLHRRTKLIQEQLPKVSMKPLSFPQPAPTAPLGAFVLLDAQTLLASPTTSSPFAEGAAKFIEDKSNPPNRAYLKLWETLTRLGRYPGPGDMCLDLGASPGGWTWVLASLGAKVTAIDKAPLDINIAALSNVTCRQDSAFSLDPKSVGPVDWLCSDVICYPDRLLELIERWRTEGQVRNFIITVKLQGETDFAAIEKFKALPNSRLVHLFHNKHELTWVGSEEAMPDYL
jgi:23S rRNA (cytidine2498-2'-O)-methyltransferase